MDETENDVEKGYKSNGGGDESDERYGAESDDEWWFVRCNLELISILFSVS